VVRDGAVLEDVEALELALGVDPSVPVWP
jgi:hypothetical protein